MALLLPPIMPVLMARLPQTAQGKAVVQLLVQQELPAVIPAPEHALHQPRLLQGQVPQAAVVAPRRHHIPEPVHLVPVEVEVEAYMAEAALLMPAVVAEVLMRLQPLP